MKAIVKEQDDLIEISKQISKLQHKTVPLNYAGNIWQK